MLSRRDSGLHEVPVAQHPSSAPQLKSRLEALLYLSGPCRLLADVGTDHALVPAHAVLRGLAERAVGVDLRAEPLRSAARTLAALGVGERVRLIQGDGLLSLAGLNADVVVLAGLSGASFVRWCIAAPEVVRSLTRLVVQPNGGVASVRRYAYEHGLHLLDENVVVERGRHFISCVFGPSSGEKDPVYERVGLPFDYAFELGPLLFERRDALALEYYALHAGRISDLTTRGGKRQGVSLAAFERGVASVEP